MEKKLIYGSTDFTATDLIYLDGSEAKRKFNIHMPFDEFQIEYKNGYWDFTPIRGVKPYDNLYYGICEIVAKTFGVNTRKSIYKGITESGKEYSVYALHVDNTFPKSDAVDYFIILYNEKLYEIRCRTSDKYFYQFPGNDDLEEPEYNEFKAIITDQMLSA
jgi:hypothetical protein